MSLVIQKQPTTIEYFAEELGDGITLKMVLIPEGSFLMGAPATEQGSSDAERPQHEVKLPLFFMGQFPVTQAQWSAVAAYPQIERELAQHPSRFTGEDRPVEQITWYEAVEFCGRLSRKTGRQYRLPSEAEWEYACRAGTTTPFHFGPTMTPDLANYNGSYSYGDGSTGVHRKETIPVSSFGVANAFGLYDMHGNVWEWCLDHWHENYHDAPRDGSAWLSENETANRVGRGGSWHSGPEHCRSAYRARGNPRNRLRDIGFRVVCSAARTP